MSDRSVTNDSKEAADIATSHRDGPLLASGIGYERPYFAYLLNAPALLVIVLLAGHPIVYSAWISLHKYSLKRPRIFDFVGLSNY